MTSSNENKKVIQSTGRLRESRKKKLSAFSIQIPTVMNHVFGVVILCLVVALVLLGYSTADNSKKKETRASERSLLENILSGRYKR